MESLVSYLFAAMLAWVPAQAHAPLETRDQAMQRYESIARDAASVALDDNEQPLFEGQDGRAQTAVFMLAIASYESSFNKQVDEGSRRGDHGNSYCLMQIRVGLGATREGWSGRQLTEDRKRCFRSALHLLQASFSACRNLPLDDRMSAYASGHCYPNGNVSRIRAGRARAWWETHALPKATGDET